MDSMIAGKDDRLELLSAEPLVLQTPLELLAVQRLTATRHLFVRNVQEAPGKLTLEAPPLAGWTLELAGLITPSLVVIRAEDLLELEQVEYEMVLQCSGNGRNRYDGAPGTPWGLGGMGNVRFSGVPLSAVLKKHGITIDSQVKFVTAEGSAQSEFEHSLPVADVLARSILALELNGERLPAVHGGPVRLVTPGYFGTMQVKWLSRLRFEVNESTNFFHANEYRVPNEPAPRGEEFTFTTKNSRPTWLLRLMSAICSPTAGAVLQAGSIDLRGVAFNDGAARIESVQVSCDRGSTWLAAQVSTPASPWAWYPWSLRTELSPGQHELWVRAGDALGRTQPLEGAVSWNPNGYEWAGVIKVDVTVVRSDEAPPSGTP